MLRNILDAVAVRMKQQIDVPRVQSIATTIRPGWDKFADVDGELRAKARVALKLGLATDRPLRILDLGCAFGYFLAVCRELGHSTFGVDGVSLREAWNAMRFNPERMEVETFDCHVAPGSAWWNAVRFDVITMMSVNLRHADGTAWGPADVLGWLGYHVQKMPTGGIIYVSINRGEPEWMVEPETWWPLGLRGTRDDNAVTLRKI